MNDHEAPTRKAGLLSAAKNGLKMFCMAQAVGELIEQGAPAFDAAEASVMAKSARPVRRG
jgi:hypothetical protein